jgi:hypothetical protein
MKWNQHAIRGSYHAVLLKPFPNRTSSFQRIRLSPDPTLRVLSELMRNVISGLLPPAPHCRLTGSAEALRPAAALPAALVGRDPHGLLWPLCPGASIGYQPPYPRGSWLPVPALLMSQVLCGLRCPLDPLIWRTRLGISLVGCKAREAPALPYTNIRLRGAVRQTALPTLCPHTS